MTFLSDSGHLDREGSGVPQRRTNSSEVVGEEFFVEVHPDPKRYASISGRDSYQQKLYGVIGGGRNEVQVRHSIIGAVSSKLQKRVACDLVQSEQRNQYRDVNGRALCRLLVPCKTEGTVDSEAIRQHGTSGGGCTLVNNINTGNDQWRNSAADQCIYQHGGSQNLHNEVER